MANVINNPLDDFVLIEKADNSLYIANDDSYGVEGTPTLEGTAKAYIVNEETGEPGVTSGKPQNAVPRDDNDKKTYDNVSDVDYDPEQEYKVEAKKEGSEG